MSTDGAPLFNDNNVNIKTTNGSAPNSLPGSPRNRVKFMCSHGGKILPRPPDGQLKYVGGETRVISVPKHISFQELMKKLTVTIDGEMTLKYQISTEDLDSLISVKTGEDLRHMFDEADRCEDAAGVAQQQQRLRAFLFPKNQTTSDAHAAVEQQRYYIDAINGIFRPPPQRQQQRKQQMVRSSPSSPNSRAAEAANIHRVLSSPSVYNLGGGGNNNNSNNSHHQHLQIHPNQYHNHYAGGLVGFQSPQTDRLMPARSVGRAEGMRYQVDPGSQYYYAVSKRAVGNNRCCVGGGRHCGGGGVVRREETAGQWPY